MYEILLYLPVVNIVTDYITLTPCVDKGMMKNEMDNSDSVETLKSKMVCFYVVLF